MGDQVKGLGYHITPRCNVQRILREGLRTDAAGWDAGYVWLLTDLGAALETARERWGGFAGKDVVILGVDTRGIELLPDPHPGLPGWRKRYSVAVASHIAPQRVSTPLRIARALVARHGEATQ
jgi:hypothetical protein